MPTIIFSQPRLPVGHQSYMNPQSQGTLLTQTFNFPPKAHSEDVIEEYLDRINERDRDVYKRAMAMLDGHIVSKLPTLTGRELREWARILLELDDRPEHVRVVYHFNESTGYDCPRVIVIKR